MIKKILPALIIIFIWTLCLSLDAVLIHQEIIKTSWYAFRIIILLVALSSVISGVLIYRTEPRGRVIWLFAGALAPYLLMLISEMFSWYLNFEIELNGLTEEFHQGVLMMLLFIPLIAFVKRLFEN